MQGRRIIFFKSLIDKTALCGADAAVAGVGGPFFGAFAVLLLSFGVVPTVFVLLIIRGFFRRNQEQYRKFAAAGTWREAIA